MHLSQQPNADVQEHKRAVDGRLAGGVGTAGAVLPATDSGAAAASGADGHRAGSAAGRPDDLHTGAGIANRPAAPHQPPAGKGIRRIAPVAFAVQETVRAADAAV